MSGLVLFIVAAVIAYVLALLWSAARPARIRDSQPWTNAWAALGRIINATSTLTIQAERLQGPLNGWPVTLVRTPDDDVVMTVELGERVFPELSLQHETLVAHLARLADVDTGDKRFDNLALIDGDPTLMKALFDKSTRELMQPWLETHDLTVQRGTLSVRLRSAQWASPIASQHLADVVQLAECLEKRTQLLPATLAALFLGQPSGEDAVSILRTLKRHFVRDPHTTRCLAAAKLARAPDVRREVGFQSEVSQDFCAELVRDSRCHFELRVNALKRLDADSQATLATWLAQDDTLKHENRLVALAFADPVTQASILTQVVFSEDLEPNLRAESLSSLERLLSAQGLDDVLVRLLKSPETLLTAEAVRIAGARDARSLKSAIEGLVLSSNSAVAEQAATALGRWADAGDEELLVRCMQRRSLGNAPGSDDVLCAAATALGSLGTLASVAHLHELSTKVIASTTTRTAALASIRAIQNRAGPVDAGRVSLLPSAVDEGAVSVASDVGALGLAADARDKDKAPS